MAAKTPSQIISENVNRLRLAKGLNQQAFGEALGFGKGAAAQRFTSRRLSGEVKWDVDELHPVAKLLGVSIAYLLRPHEDAHTK